MHDAPAGYTEYQPYTVALIKLDDGPLVSAQLTDVGRVVVVGFYGDERYYGFSVETSLDGEQWTVVADHRPRKGERQRSVGFSTRKDHRRDV